MSDDLFTPPKGEHQQDNANEGSTNPLEELVGEGKKYKDQVELAKAYKHADSYIESLKRELGEVRQEADKRATLEDLVEKITKATTNRSSDPAPQGNESISVPGNDHNNETRNTNQSYDPKEIERLVVERIEQETNKRTQASNLESVRAELSKHWGPGYVDKLKSKANELGLSPEQLNNLAATQPKLFRTAVGLNNTNSSNSEVSTTPPANRRNNSAATPVTNDGSIRNKAYYDKLRKENLNEFLKGKTQVQMHKDAMSLGESFYN